MSDRDCEKCKHHTEKGCDSWDCNFERRMARKEIIEMLKVLKEQALESHNDTAIIDVKKDSFIYVMDATINSLKMEQIEPCEDAISRQAVLDAIENDNRNGHYSCFASNNDAQCFKGVICELPSVNPEEPFMNKPCVAHQICHEDKIKVLNKIRAEIERLADDEWNKQVGSVSQGLEDAIEIIDKYKAESEGEE